MIDLIERGLATIPDEQAPDRLGKLERLLRRSGLDDPATVSLFAALIGASDGAMPELAPDQRKKRTLAAILSWLAADAQRQPLVMVVEDLHWIDASTLELLGLVLEQLGEPAGARGVHVPARVRSGLGAELARDDAPARAPRARRRSRASRRRPPAGAPLPATAARRDRRAHRRRAAVRRGAVQGAARPRRRRRARGSPRAGWDRSRAARSRARCATRSWRASTASAAPSAVAQLASVLGRDFAYPLLRAVSDLPDAELDTQLAVLTRAEILLQRGLPPTCALRLQARAHPGGRLRHAAEEQPRAAPPARRRDLPRALRGRSARQSGGRGAPLQPRRDAARRRASTGRRRASSRSSRSGYAEAIGHFNTALELLAPCCRSRRSATAVSCRCASSSGLRSAP